MRKDLVHIDLFACTGGFSLGLHDAGIEPDHHYLSEIEKHPIANLKYNFPTATQLGDVRTVSGTELRKKHPTAIFFVTFGWPCQDNSIAGKRQGQKHRDKGNIYASKDETRKSRNSGAESLEPTEETSNRSGLLYEAVRIIRECRADYFIAENVKGLLSVNSGIDILESLIVLAGLSEDCPQHDIEMQLFNTLWYLPQNRERTYFIGRTRNQGGQEVLPITENEGNPFKASKGYFNLSTGYCNAITSKVDHNTANFIHTPLVAKEIRTEESKIARKKAAKKGKDHTPFRGKNVVFVDQDYMNTLTANRNTEHLIGIMGYTRSKEGKESTNHIKQSANTLHGSTGQGGNTDQFVIIDRSGNPKNNKGFASCLTQGGHGGGNHSDMDLLLFSNEVKSVLALNGRVKPKMTASTITKGNRGSSNTGDMDLMLLETGEIRRLTEIECERLQGFPDNWTQTGIDPEGKAYLIPSTPRYSMIGNACSVIVVTTIGLLIKPELEKLLNQ